MSNDLPKLAIVGYGNMGKAVENAAKEKGFEITDIFDINSLIDTEKSYNFDVAIDFSFPSSVIDNIGKLCKLNKNIVVGTTGWKQSFNDIESIVKENKTGLIYGSNFSIGMQLYMKLIEDISKMLINTDGYDIFIHEIHHKRKKDSPSGTALSLADIIINNYTSKKTIITETAHTAIEPEQLHITSTRGGEISGTHTVYIDSIADTIEITHRAKNRNGFAVGALEAAKWIHNKKGIYDFNKIIYDILNY
jgi:4-hydroxy-tetrahydrodipicolinate reductase